MLEGLGRDLMEGRVTVLIREFELEKDREAADAIDRVCEVGPSGKMTLFTDLLGDPVSRVRHSPAFLMLVRIYLTSSFLFLKKKKFISIYLNIYLIYIYI